MPAPVVELARAKINLALHITRRRKDGYHELDSIVAFADIADRLTFHFLDSSEISITYTGLFGGELRDAGNDIVLKAASLLQEHYRPNKPGAHITLEKNLPLASGIGGGSADAAAALRGLVRLWKIGVSESELLELAVELGADVPVCLHSVPMRMTGIGDQLQALTSFRPLSAVLANPGITLATKAVFDALGLGLGDQGFELVTNIGKLTSCRNDMEKPAIKLVPAIADVLAMLRSQPGLTLARMSGSGATCFGLFESTEAAAAAAQKIKQSRPAWWIVTTTLA
jgi:4-diphosphocytidyl-2-C-methyl-D-erythritol kinase